MEEKVLVKSEQYDMKKIFGNGVLAWTIVVGVKLILAFISDSYYFASQLKQLAFISVLLFVSLGFLWFLGWSYELTVTNKRVYGKIIWGKRVDLPLDSITATATTLLLKGISISTSSGRINFLYIKNADEVYTVINDLLIKRQQEKANPAPTVISQQSDEADQLKKYKALLDDGVISQEEFDAKKKQLLGL